MQKRVLYFFTHATGGKTKLGWWRKNRQMSGEIWWKMVTSFLTRKCRHHFIPKFSTHLAAIKIFSELLLVRHPISLSVYSLCSYMLTTRADVNIQLQHMSHYSDMTASERQHYDWFGLTLRVPIVANKLYSISADANNQLQHMAGRMLQSNADICAC